jgi:DNA-binding SARP family transcriptional activator
MARQDLERVFVLSLHFLGPTRVERDGEVMGLPPSRKTRALLAYLALTGRPHRRERLCSLLWDIPDDPRGALRWSLSRIRALVDEPDLRRIVADRDTVRFDAHGALIDVLNLRWASGGGLGTIPTEDLEAVATGSDGELLEGEEFPEHHAFHSWCIAEREEARAARVRVLSALVKRLGSKPRKALPHARALVELQSDREEAWAALVELLTSAGRHREAEEQCELARRVLQEAGAPVSGPLNRASPNVRQPSSGSHSTSFEPDRAVGDKADKPRAHPSRVGTSLSTGEALAPTTDSPLLLKPSIAVLPFTSLGSDPADEWFSDGLTEDLITDLSRQAGFVRHRA